MEHFGNINLQSNALQNAELQSTTVSVSIDFPTVGVVVGRLAFVSQVLYMCIALDNNRPIWFPLTNKISTFVHTQTTAALTWAVNHNLNTSQPIVQIYDDTNNIVQPQTISVVDADNITVTFDSVLTTGRAVVMYGNLLPQEDVAVVLPPLSGEFGFVPHNLDPATKAPSIVLSNNDLSFLDSGQQGVHNEVYSTTSHVVGKYAFEFDDTAIGSPTIGIRSVNTIDNTAIGFSTDSIGIRPNDTRLWQEGAQEDDPLLVSVQPIKVTMVLIDFDNKKFQVKQDNVALGTFTFSLATTAFYAAFTQVNINKVATVNFGASPFTNPITDGYASWDGTQKAVTPFGHKAWRLNFSKIDNVPPDNTFTLQIRQLELLYNGINKGTGQSGIAFASSQLGAAIPENPFSPSTSSWALGSSVTLPQQLGFIYDSLIDVDEYRITLNSTNGPEDFTLEYSDDTTDGADGTWVVAHTVTGEIGWSTGETRTFTI